MRLCPLYGIGMWQIIRFLILVPNCSLHSWLHVSKATHCIGIVHKVFDNFVLYFLVSGLEKWSMFVHLTPMRTNVPMPKRCCSRRRRWWGAAGGGNGRGGSFVCGGSGRNKRTHNHKADNQPFSPWDYVNITVASGPATNSWKISGILWHVMRPNVTWPYVIFFHERSCFYQTWFPVYLFHSHQGERLLLGDWILARMSVTTVLAQSSHHQFCFVAFQLSISCELSHDKCIG